jgi:hypothetical protein
MAFLGLCSDDFLITTLRDVFGANPVRVPEMRLAPLVVLASNGRTTSFRGSLAPLLRGAPAFDIDVARSRTANLSGRRSRQVKAEVGLEILEGFLSGMGLPSAAVAAKFAGAKTVSFSFEDVQRVWVDPAIVGLQLSNKVIDAAQPAATIFLDGTHQFLIVDSTIQSRDFNIKVESASNGGFSLDVPAIQEMVGKVNTALQVSNASSTDITFKGESYLSFAFSCLRLNVDANGKVTSMPPAGNVPTLAGASAAAGERPATQKGALAAATARRSAAAHTELPDRTHVLVWTPPPRHLS